MELPVGMGRGKAGPAGGRGNRPPPRKAADRIHTMLRVLLRKDRREGQEEMRMIHAADIHLSSGMDSAFPRDLAEERRQGLREAFVRMAENAGRIGARAVLLAGDVFDSDRPSTKDREFFRGVVSSFPGTDFLYLRGNHDTGGAPLGELDNLKTFKSSWTRYDYGDVTVSGIELGEENCLSLYGQLDLPKGKTNIVMLHGQTSDSPGKDRVCLRMLAGKNIDYLALGHVHRPQCGRLDERGEWAYSGCLQGRGFDEPGEHGYYVLDIGDGGVACKFVADRAFGVVETEVDVTGIAGAYAAACRVREQTDFDSRCVYRVRLTGEADALSDDLAGDVESYLADWRLCRLVRVKDERRRRIDAEAYAHDVSLRGEFVRTVLASPDYTEEEKARIVRCGLRALAGEEIKP